MECVVSGLFDLDEDYKDYYVIERNDVYIAIPDERNVRSILRSLYAQGFDDFDSAWEGRRRSIFATSPQEAIEKAKRYKENEINKLKSEISRLKSDKEFSLKDRDAYEVFGVRDGTPLKEIEPIRRELLKYFHPDSGKVKSDFMTKIINGAWDSIK